jgi:hypothetical protein
VINGTSSVPSQVYSTGMAAPSSHGPANCSCVASVPPAAVDGVGDDDVGAGDELVDELELDELVVVVVVVDVSGTTSGGAVVVVVVVVVEVVVWESL